MTFLEAQILGKWTPRTYADKPTIKDGRIVTVSGQGPRVRQVTEVPPYLQHIKLGELVEVYGKDGRFQAC